MAIEDISSNNFHTELSKLIEIPPGCISYTIHSEVNAVVTMKTTQLVRMRAGGKEITKKYRLVEVERYRCVSSLQRTVRTIKDNREIAHEIERNFCHK